MMLVFNEKTGLFDDVEENHNNTSSLSRLSGNYIPLVAEFFVALLALFMLGYLCAFSILLVMGLAVNTIAHILISLVITVFLMIKIQYYDKV